MSHQKVTAKFPTDAERGLSAMVRQPKPHRRGRPPVPIERDPQRFEIACWSAQSEKAGGL